MNFPFSWIATYVLKKKGLRSSVFIGSVLAYVSSIYESTSIGFLELG